MSQRAIIRPLLPHLYLIDDAGASTCYVLCGTEKAAVIDTVNGLENLHDIVRTLTDLPLVVINTHGHCDHIYGNLYFEEALMHPADFDLAKLHFGFIQDQMDKHSISPCPLTPLTAGEVIDLGGICLEVVSLKGHTGGSIGLIDIQDRILFSGDGANTHLWMQLDESLPIEVLRQTLLDLKRDHIRKFDRILTGHAKDFCPAHIIDWLLNACAELLAGQTEQDKPYRYFGGECSRHPLSENEDECIVYWKNRL